MTTFDGDGFARPRAVESWPAGHRAALCLTINVAAAAGGDASQSPAFEPAYERTGAARLLRLLADTGVASTWTWSRPAMAADAGLIELVGAGGHEAAARIEGPPDGTWPEALGEIRDELTRSAGAEVVGYRLIGPGDREALYRAGQDLGFRWVLDQPAGDVPVLLQPDGTRPPIVHLPTSRWFDDRHLFADHALVARHAFEAWRDDLDTIRDDGGVMIVSLHPSVSGRPGPSRAVAQFLDHAIETGDLWITRADHLALWWADQHGSS